MSTEFDMIYVQEAVELQEQDWESLTTRLRNGAMPYQQLGADTNPDAPTHWLKRRCDAGKTLLIESRHEDNPTVTADYLAKLDALTGVRYLRLRKGLWAGAEGLVYDGWDPAIHLIDAMPAGWESWRKLRVADFGFTNPFVAHWWAIDPDGRAYLYREIYHTGRTVRVHSGQINRLSAGESYEATLADHDAEDRATLRECGIETLAAHKAVTPGIEAVQERLKRAGDGRPRLFVLKGCRVERDPALVEARKPTCTEEEWAGYIWQPPQPGRPPREEPRKIDDHGMDATRYMAAYVDGLGYYSAGAY
jgi:phage terminase large subunit